jgi:hypothetical protein
MHVMCVIERLLLAAIGEHINIICTVGTMCSSVMCDMSFATSNGLYKHQSIPNMEQPCSCDMREKPLKHKSYLRTYQHCNM